MPDSAADPLLTSALARFYTEDENKDDDTWLECWINLPGEHEAAYVASDGMEFIPRSTHDLLLRPKTNPMRRSQIPGSWFQVRIHPVGNDTWRFHCDVMLYFEDGSNYPKEFPESTDINQDEHRNQAKFYL